MVLALFAPVEPTTTVLVLQIVERMHRDGVPDIEYLRGIRCAADPVHLRHVVFDGLFAGHLRHNDRRERRGDGQAIARRDIVEIVHADRAARARA